MKLRLRAENTYLIALAIAIMLFGCGDESELSLKKTQITSMILLDSESDAPQSLHVDPVGDDFFCSYLHQDTMIRFEMVSEDGQELWQATSSGITEHNATLVDNDTVFVISGTHLLKFRKDGDILGVHFNLLSELEDYQIKGALINTRGNFVFFGVFPISSRYGVLIELDRLGNRVFRTIYKANTNFTDCFQEESGEYFCLSDGAPNDPNFLFIKFDQDGKEIWQKKYKDPAFVQFSTQAPRTSRVIRLGQDKMALYFSTGSAGYPFVFTVDREGEFLDSLRFSSSVRGNTIIDVAGPKINGEMHALVMENTTYRNGVRGSTMEVRISENLEVLYSNNVQTIYQDQFTSICSNQRGKSAYLGSIVNHNDIFKPILIISD